MEISMMTLNASGTLLPGVTWSKDMMGKVMEKVEQWERRLRQILPS
jgi:hypothetical protein